MNAACGRAHDDGDEVPLPSSSFVPCPFFFPCSISLKTRFLSHGRTRATDRLRVALEAPLLLEKQVRLPATASWATKQLPIVVVVDESLPALSATLKPPRPPRAPKRRAKPTQLELDERYARALELQFAREHEHEQLESPCSPALAPTSISPSRRRPPSLAHEPRALPPHLDSLPSLTRSQRKRLARGGAEADPSCSEQTTPPPLEQHQHPTTDPEPRPPTTKRPPRRRGGVKHRSAAAKLAAKLAALDPAPPPPPPPVPPPQPTLQPLLPPRPPPPTTRDEGAGRLHSAIRNWLR